VIGSKLGHSFDSVIAGAYRLLFGNTIINPNVLTLLGLGFSLAGAILAAQERLLVSGLLVIVSGLFDLFDGAIARRGGRVTRFGGFLDSVLDRYSDLCLMLGIGISFLRRGEDSYCLLTFFAAIGVAIIPYVKARAEAASATCDSGLLERPERIILLVIGLLFGVIKPIIIILAVLTHFTVIQRILFVKKMMKERKM
jgi:CDP-diacylglycerol---glycerol-3-phosphate 3-phosphatidyltransferase